MTTILVVDDSRLSRDLVRGFLERLRPEWRVVGAASADAALRAAERTPPDAVLVDMIPPGMEGLALAQHLRERFPDAPVGVSCSDPRGGSRCRVLKLGCLFVPKPLTPDRLMPFVAAIRSR